MKIKISEKNREFILLAIILVLAILLRIFKFILHQGPLNQDEASIGYDAYALLRYGVDRNNCTLPVHLIAWGSGQNALYAYLLMPVIAVLGLTVNAVRSVNFIAGILSIIAVYYIGKELFSKKCGFIIAIMFAISPWHIMLSCWGLESNLFPAMFIFGVLFLIYAFKKPGLIYISVVFFSLCLYSYGSAYVVIPIFMLVALEEIIRKKLIPVKNIIIAFLIFVILSAPIIAFVIINKFGFETLKIGAITIPAMTGEARLNMMTENRNISDIFKGIYSAVILQSNGEIYNSLPFYGCFYVPSLIATFVGVLVAIKRHKTGDILVLSALAGSFGIFFMLNAININRVNVIYVPLIILTAIGLNTITEIFKNKILNISLMLLISIFYIVMLTGFIKTYYGEEYNDMLGKITAASLTDSIEYAYELSNELDMDIYVSTQTVNAPYIYALFVTKADVHDYIDTVQFVDKKQQFQIVNSYGKWHFNVDYNDGFKKGIYIAENYRLPKDYKSIKRFEKFSVMVIE